MTNLDASQLADRTAAAAAGAGSVIGAPRLVLRLESLAMLAVAIAAYRVLGGSWVVFAALFLVPDLSMLAYLAGPRIGAAVYNAAHALIGPALVAPFAPLLALIWVAHIGFDRALGYGLKYSSRFSATHLGVIGRSGARSSAAREPTRLARRAPPVGAHRA